MNETTALSFEQHDKLALKAFCQKLERFLIVEHGFVEGGLVVSLNAPFGAGKTTFLSMWKGDLDDRRQKDATTPQVIMLNAWESDYCGDPLLSIVAELIKAAKGDAPDSEQSAAHRLREAAKDVAWFSIGLANKVASSWIDLDPLAAGELAEAKKKERNSKKPDFVGLYEDRSKVLKTLKDTLKDVFKDEHPKAFVFVDELDRCRPDYAIAYLETIKHVFDVHGLVFVLAVDYEQLASSARALFGQDLNFAEYFRKFVQRGFTLPEPTEASLRTLARHFAASYFEKEGRRVTLLGDTHYRVENCIELMSALQMTPRQVQEAFRIIGHAVEAGDVARRGQLLWGFGVGTILMAALKVSKPKLYRSIGSGQLSHLAVGRFLVKLFGLQKGEWWFIIYVTGAGREDPQEKVDFAKLFVDLGLRPDVNGFDSQRVFQGFGDCWNSSGNAAFRRIYKSIETATTF